jgi:hypothetical protein
MAISKIESAGLGAGTVLQVVQTVKTDFFSTSSAMPTFVDITGMSATITPKFANSKILVTVTGLMSISANGYASAVNLVRGSTSIAIGDARGSSTRASAGSGVGGTGSAAPFALSVLDSPATTSATTYKLQLSVESGASSNIGGSYISSQAYHYSTPTTITLQEIAQ